jgi:AAA+ superfamily predicted ATPase/intein/homing endonuclease
MASDKASEKSDLLFLIRSLTRVIYYVTDEEDQALISLASSLKKSAKNIWVFNAAFGIRPLSEHIGDWKSQQHKDSGKDIHDLLIEAYKADPKEEVNFYIITDPERWLRDEHVQRRVLNFIHQVHNNVHTIKMLIFVGSQKFIPHNLQRYISVVHDPGPGEKEIEEIIRVAASKMTMPVPPGISDLFRGLTRFEIHSAIAQSVIRTREEDPDNPRIDPAHILEFRRRQIHKTDLLQYVDTTKFTMGDLGGTHRFKTWAKKTRACWTPEGKLYGLKPPRGVLCVGVWGCGKSLATKCLGSLWGLPVVQLELGRLQGGRVGESESNAYRALRIIESLAPCVTGETLVTLADGTCRPIASLWEDSVSGSNEELHVQCWNERTLRVETTRVHTVTRRKAEAFRVEAANGFYVNATANHLHYVMRGGMPEWVRTDELSPGDMMAVPTAKYEGNEDCVRFHPKGMRVYDRNGEVEFRRGGGGFRDAVVPRLPVRWSTDLGWVLGALEGDGFIGANDGIGFTNTSTVLLGAFERVVSESFGIEPKRYLHDQTELPPLHGLSKDPDFKPCWTTVVVNQLAAEFLRSARESILSAPPQVRAAFVAGWIDADGCIQPDKISLSVKHSMQWHARQLLARQLIQSLGVVPSKFDMPNLEVTGTRAVALAAILKEFLIEKNVKATHVTSSEIGFDRGMGFACGRLLHDVRKASGVMWENIDVSSGVTWSYENGHVPVSERHLKNYARIFGDAGADLQHLLDAECRWVKVTSVESVGNQDVYDLACEGDDTHSFIANGLVTHNCIVWVDEAEKSFAGTHSSSQSDAGTVARVVGILSTWIQETKAQVCLVMTANSLSTLPVEFVNRMDERFFFDLPSTQERIDILKIHLRKANQSPEDYNLADLAEKANNMVGREIEQALNAALIESFNERMPCLDEGILGQTLEKKPRIVKTMVDEVRAVLEWVGYDEGVDDGIRARFASEPNRNEGSFKFVQKV